MIKELCGDNEKKWRKIVDPDFPEDLLKNMRNLSESFAFEDDEKQKLWNYVNRFCSLLREPVLKLPKMDHKYITVYRWTPKNKKNGRFRPHLPRKN